MSALRKHIQAARAEYQSARYPGDLAADLLRPPRHAGRWIIAIGAVAAAAVVAIVVLVNTRTQPTQIVVDDKGIDVPDDEVEYVEVAPAFSPSEFGSEEALTLPASDFSFSMPSISFVEDEASQDTSTTQEAIS